MALIAGLAIRQVTNQHRHGMGSAVVLGMTGKLSSMASDTLATSRMAVGTADQTAGRRAVTGLAAFAAMGLASHHKRGVGSGVMAANTVGGGWRRGGIDLHQACVILMVGIIEISAVTALAVGASCLAGGATLQVAIAAVVTGITPQGDMGLSAGDIWSNQSTMTVKTQTYGRHRVCVRMTVKIGGMAGLAVGSGQLAVRAADQEAGRYTMTGLTGQMSGISLRPGHIGRRGGSMTNRRAQRHRAHRMILIMTVARGAKVITTMTGGTATTTSRHEKRLAANAGVGSLQNDGIIGIVVTSGTGVVDLAITNINRHPGCITSCPCMTGRAGKCIAYPRAMVAAKGGTGYVTLRRAGGVDRARRVVMHNAGGIGRYVMAIGTGTALQGAK